MNWLFYIGGGCLFWVVYNIILSAFLDYGKISAVENKSDISLIIDIMIVFITPILLWAWLCWRFLR